METSINTMSGASSLTSLIGFHAVGGFADDFEIFLVGQTRQQPFADNGMIVHDQNFDFLFESAHGANALASGLP